MRRSVIIPVITVFLLIALLIPPGAAMKDPSAVYCGAMGYPYTIVQTAAGPVGSCLLPDGTTVDSWRFLQGSAGQQFSYCARQGYRQQVVRSYRICSIFGLDECLVCVLPEGSTREVTSLMNLSFAETTCGDGTCGSPENALSCPTDCKSGGWDSLCDGIRDGRCDPDCPDGKGDPDCGGPGPALPNLAGLILVIVAGAAIFLYLARKRSS